MNIPGNPEYVGAVRMAVAHIAKIAGFDIEAIDDVKVAVSEACSNVICHAHEGQEFTYDIYTDLDDKGLTITVKDCGMGFGLEDYVEPDPGDPRGRGLGIFIIKALMDEVSIDSAPGAGTNIIMTKYLRNEIA